jgi:hypothetical protein
MLTRLIQTSHHKFRTSYHKPNSSNASEKNGLFIDKESIDFADFYSYI